MLVYQRVGFFSNRYLRFTMAYSTKECNHKSLLDAKWSLGRLMRCGARRPAFPKKVAGKYPHYNGPTWRFIAGKRFELCIYIYIYTYNNIYIYRESYIYISYIYTYKWWIFQPRLINIGHSIDYNHPFGVGSFDPYVTTGRNR